MGNAKSTGKPASASKKQKQQRMRSQSSPAPTTALEASGYVSPASLAPEVEPKPAGLNGATAAADDSAQLEQDGVQRLSGTASAPLRGAGGVAGDSSASVATPAPSASQTPPPILMPKPARAAGPPPVAPKPNTFRTENIELPWLMDSGPTPGASAGAGGGSGGGSGATPASPVLADGEDERSAADVPVPVPRRNFGVAVMGSSIADELARRRRANTEAAGAASGTETGAARATSPPTVAQRPRSGSAARTNPDGGPIDRDARRASNVDVLQMTDVRRASSAEGAPDLRGSTMPKQLAAVNTASVRVPSSSTLGSPLRARASVDLSAATGSPSPAPAVAVRGAADTPTKPPAVDPLKKPKLVPDASADAQQPPKPSTEAAPAPAMSAEPAAFDALKTDAPLAPSPKKDLAKLQKGQKRMPRKPVRIYLEDDTYKAIPLSTTQTAAEVLAEMLEKNRVEEADAKRYRLFEVDADSAAQRELAEDEVPLAVMFGWPELIRANMRLYFKKTSAPVRKVGRNTLKRQKDAQKLLVKRIAYRGVVALADGSQTDVALTYETSANDVIQQVFKVAKLKGKPEEYKIFQVQGDEAPQPLGDGAHPFDTMLSWGGRPDCKFLLKKP